MKPFSSILAISLPFIWSIAAPMASAQTDGPTPRHIFTSFVTNTPLNELKFKPISVPAAPQPAISPLPEPAAPAEDAADASTQDTVDMPSLPPVTETEKSVSVKEEEKAPAEKLASLPPPPKPEPKAEISSKPVLPDAETDPSEMTPTETTPEPKIVNPPAETDIVPPLPDMGAAPVIQTEPEPQLAGSAKNTKAPDEVPLLPFYTSAESYLAARGMNKQTQLQLVYKVSLAGAKSNLTTSVETRTITIGADFAASEQDGTTRIWDFKTNRLLTLTPQDSHMVFSNISLYAGALKNVQTVNRATNKGQISDIELSRNVTLKSFWLEASLGWAARSEFESLDVKRDGSDVSSSFSGLLPFSASLTGPKMPSEDHMRALFAWFHHDLPIHPAILPLMGRPDNAPQTMQILSLSPQFPNGLIAKWELIGSKQMEERFPLPRTAKTSIELGQSSALAFAISQAARGSALANRPSANDLRQEIHESKTAGRNFEAWLTAQSLADQLGGCAKDPALLCKDIAALEEAAEPGSDLAKLPKIIKKARRPSTRLEGFKALAPYVEDKIAPGFLVKIAGQARARIKTKNLTDPKLKALRADKLLEEALVKNPYDPVIYRTLGQVYAAQGNLAESWDMQDAMRQLPDVRTALSDPINWAERSLLVRAPGFFMQDTP